MKGSIIGFGLNEEGVLGIGRKEREKEEKICYNVEPILGFSLGEKERKKEEEEEEEKEQIAVAAGKKKQTKKERIKMIIIKVILML